MWNVAFEDRFFAEAAEFPDEVRAEIAALAALLGMFGPGLKRPHCDTLNGSKHANMKELRFKAAGGVWRVAFAFDRDPACGRRQIRGQREALLQGSDRYRR